MVRVSGTCRRMVEMSSSGSKNLYDKPHRNEILCGNPDDRVFRTCLSATYASRPLKTRGIAFHSLTEQMDTTTPQGEFLFHVFGALAQFERSLTQERVNAGLAAARRRGRSRTP